jgi:hypothetical protein
MKYEEVIKKFKNKYVVNNKASHLDWPIKSVDLYKVYNGVGGFVVELDLGRLDGREIVYIGTLKSCMEYLIDHGYVIERY